MNLIFPEGMHFDCGACTRCCRGSWTVHLDPHAWRKIQASALYAQMTREDGEAPAYIEDPSVGEASARTRMVDGRCVFLAPDRACLVHREVGVSAKPFGCSQFPFILRPTPDGVYVGVSFYCSAVQANHGRSLDAHAGDLERSRQHHHFPAVGESVPLDSRQHIPWALYRDIETAATETLSGKAPLRERTWQAATRILLLSSALTRHPGDPQDLWRRVRAVVVPRDEIFSALEDMLLVGIVGTIESRDPTHCKASTEAIFFRRTLETESFGAVDLTHFDDFRRRFDAAWTDDAWQRYLSHLLFRKFLPHKRSLAANTAAWRMALPLLDWYRDLSAFTAGRLQPDVSDVHRAFDIVERSFTHHTNLLDGLYDELARGYLRLLDTMPELIPGAHA